MKPIPSSRLRRIAALLVATVATSTAIFMSTSAQADDSLVGFSWFGGGHRVTGSGNLANENRVVTGFQAIALRTSMKDLPAGPGDKGNIKILTSCPSCLQGLTRYGNDLQNGLLEADYIVVEMANRILGDNWMPDYVHAANSGGIERVLV